MPAKKKTPAKTRSEEIRIEYMALSALTKWDRNPKLHNEDAINASVSRFGFISPILINEKTGILVAGHGRVEELERRKAAGEPPPSRISVRKGEWYVPVIRGVSFATDEEAAAYAIADNRLVELGGWDSEGLASVLDEVKETDFGLDGLGFDDDDLREFHAKGGGGSGGEGKGDGGVTYSKKIKAPIYEPKGERPKVQDLFDDDKTNALVEEIDKAKIPADVAIFLRLAAERHTAFNFHRIAEFYSHASPEVQDLMERSGLVIIDFDKAIENGFVYMTERLGEIADGEGFNAS